MALIRWFYASARWNANKPQISCRRNKKQNVLRRFSNVFATEYFTSAKKSKHKPKSRNGITKYRRELRFYRTRSNCRYSASNDSSAKASSVRRTISLFWKLSLVVPEMESEIAIKSAFADKVDSILFLLNFRFMIHLLHLIFRILRIFYGARMRFDSCCFFTSRFTISISLQVEVFLQ